MTIQKVTVFGTGNFGARIAFHMAFNKVDVTVYDQNYGLLEEARTKFREFGLYYRDKFNTGEKEIDAALANIAYSMDITEAAGNAELIIEAVAEDIKIKKDFYKKLQKAAPKNAIFASTSMGLDPETLAKASARPDQFLNLYFDAGINESNAVRIVALPSARPNVLNPVADFFENIGLHVTVNHLEQQNQEPDY